MPNNELTVNTVNELVSHYVLHRKYAPSGLI
jgi:hypothetical protein